MINEEQLPSAERQPERGGCGPPRRFPVRVVEVGKAFDKDEAVVRAIKLAREEIEKRVDEIFRNSDCPSGCRKVNRQPEYGNLPEPKLAKGFPEQRTYKLKIQPTRILRPIVFEVPYWVAVAELDFVCSFDCVVA